MNRWTVAFHEAGHAVAAFALTGMRVVATLHENSGGAAWPLEELSPTDTAIMTAAGPLAEPLANRYAAPDFPPTVAGNTSSSALPNLETVATLETAAELKSVFTKSISDHVVIARWCIAGVEKHPERWAQRHAWVQTLAARLIRDHEQ